MSSQKLIVLLIFIFSFNLLADGEIDPKGRFVFTESNNAEGSRPQYTLKNSATGSIIKIIGKPVWSSNGDYFVSIQSDLESGWYGNSAKIYHCNERKCKAIIDLIKPDSKNTGGKSAHWIDKNKTEITLNRLAPIKNAPPPPAVQSEYIEKTIACELNGEKTICRAIKDWPTLVSDFRNFFIRKRYLRFKKGIIAYRELCSAFASDDPSRIVRPCHQEHDKTSRQTDAAEAPLVFDFFTALGRINRIIK